MTPAAARAPRSSATRPLAELFREVVSIPTASYLEGLVLDYVRRFAEERGLAYEQDAYGNAYVTYRRGPARRPLVLGTHTDHPGFVVREVRGRDAQLEFRGGLAAEYGKGERLVIYDPASGEARGGARIRSVQASRGAGGARITGARGTLERGVASVAGDLALWDVDVCRVRGGVVRARQCDDLAGCVAVLATLDRLAAVRPNGHVIGLFTRAEEIGLRGAAVVGRERLLPDDALVVAVETSSMAGGRAEQGGGPIVRIGDAVHVFSPRMTQWMVALCQAMRDEDPAFAYQRKLMDGGTTEATAYDLYGYETGAACIALGNYHNAGRKGRVAPETVHLGDLEGLVQLFLRMAETVPRYQSYLPALKRRFDRLGRDAASTLRASATPELKPPEPAEAPASPSPRRRRPRINLPRRAARRRGDRGT
jgi:endoglucanase